MEEDISKKAVVVLLFLTIIISIIGTLVVVEEAQSIKAAGKTELAGAAAQQTPQEGQLNEVSGISLNIIPRPDK